MKYCPTTTTSHPLAVSQPAFVEDVNAIIIAEGHMGVSPFFINNEVAINLDKAKRPVAVALGVNMDQSMDMAVGVKDDATSDKEILLVDFKLNTVNPTRVSKGDMIGKVSGSQALLGNSVPIRNEYIFVFQSNLVAQAQRWFFRRHAAIPAAYIAMDIHTLQSTYF